MKPLRIALVARKYFQFGGKEQFLEDLLRGFIKRGHEVHVIATSWDSPTLEEFQVPLHKIRIMRGESWMKAWSFARGVKKFVAENSFDCVVSLEKVLGADVYITCDGCFQEQLSQRESYRSWLFRLTKKFNPRYIAMCRLEKKLYTSPDVKAVIAISDKVKQHVFKHYKVDQQKFFVVHHGIDPEYGCRLTREQARQQISQDFSVDDSQVWFLYVGSGFERKGVNYLLEAVKQIPAECNFRLFVVGRDNIPKYQSKANKLGVASKVIFTGALKEVKTMYRAADVFVVPTLYEPFGLVYLEALIHGLPVIASEEAGASEIIKDRYLGIVVPPQEPQKIAHAMQKYMQPNKREGQNQRIQFAKENYTLDQNVDAILDIVKDVAQQKQNR